MYSAFKQIVRVCPKALRPWDRLYIHIVLENDIKDQDGDGDIDMNDYDIISQSSSQGSNQVGHSTGYSKKAQQNMWNEIKTLTKDKKVFKNESWNCN